jgi:hypothetical protein
MQHELPRRFRHGGVQLHPGVRPAHPLSESVGDVADWIRTHEVVRSPQLSGGILNAALELEHQDLVSVEHLEQCL